KLRVAGDHHQQIVEVMGNTASQPANGLHLLGLAQLLLERPALGYVFGEDLECDVLLFVCDRASREPDVRDRTILAGPLRSKSFEILARAQLVGENKPQLTVRIQRAQISSDQVVRRFIAERTYQCRIGVYEVSTSVAAADAIGSIRDQRTEIAFRA